ncbi:MAG: hypothetical protein HQK96_12590 [Nitrospirae bacterium]|nr:hypothetical protein [Nitrospirota bacterium]
MKRKLHAAAILVPAIPAAAILVADILAVFMYCVLPALAADESDLPKLTTTKPPFTEGIFPCTSCHASMPPNKEKRVHGRQPRPG